MKLKYYLFLLTNLFITFSGVILFTSTYFVETPLWYKTLSTLFLIFSCIVILANIISMFLSITEYSVISILTLSVLFRSKKLYSSKTPGYKYFMVTERNREDKRLCDYKLFHLKNIFYLKSCSSILTFTLSDVNNGHLKTYIKKLIESHHSEEMESDRNMGDIGEFFGKWNGSLDETSHRDKEIDKII